MFYMVGTILVRLRSISKPFQGLVVVFDTALSDAESFVCVCRPRIEQWQVGKGQTVLGSVIEEQVRIHISKNTFDTRAILRLQVICNL